MKTRVLGPYRIGPKEEGFPIKCIDNYLARKEGTDEFYVLRVVKLKPPGEKKTDDDLRATTLVTNEHLLLTFLKEEEGIIQDHGMFKKTFNEEITNSDGEIISEENTYVYLVLDCYLGHEFSPYFSSITNLHNHVILNKKLPESKAIRIFYPLLKIVARLHSLNIVHRDVKLGNIIYNTDTKDVKLVNFMMARHICSSNALVTDRCGSPAYISPEICKNNEPYACKPADVWSLGVVLYTMLYGKFPFYDEDRNNLYAKIQTGNFEIPRDVIVTMTTVELIRGLLALDPTNRLTACQALEHAKRIIDVEVSLLSDNNLQVVPVCNPNVITTVMKHKASTSQHELAATQSKSETAPVDVLSLHLDNSKNDRPVTEEQLKLIHAHFVAQSILEAAKMGTLSIEVIADAVDSTSPGTNVTKIIATTTAHAGGSYYCKAELPVSVRSCGIKK